LSIFHIHKNNKYTGNCPFNKEYQILNEIESNLRRDL